MGDVIACYAFFEATNDELKALWQACESNAADPLNGGCDWVCRAGPMPCWPLEPDADEATKEAKIKELLEYHRQHASTKLDDGQKQYDSNYLAVAIDRDWRTEGVMAITSNKYDFHDVPDMEEESIYKEKWCEEARARGYDRFMFKPGNIGLMFINLQIANMGWDEYRDWQDVHPEKRKIDANEENDELEGPSKKALKVNKEHEQQGDDSAPRKKLVSDKELEDIGIDPGSLQSAI